MKELVCDFCDSIRLGAKTGYKAFKKEFQSARKIRNIAKASNFLGGETYKLKDTTTKQDKNVNDIRELAQKNYREDNDLHIPEQKY